MSSLDGRQFPAKSDGNGLRPVRQPDVKYDPVIATIDAAIIVAVQAAPGSPTTNMLGGVSGYLAANSDTSEPIHPSWIPDRLNALAEAGEITRLLSQDGNGFNREYTYYPKEWQFKTTPRTQFLGNYKRPKGLDGMLSPGGQIIVDSFVGLFSQIPESLILRIVTQYCDRCGKLKEGHYCNE